MVHDDRLREPHARRGVLRAATRGPLNAPGEGGEFYIRFPHLVAALKRRRLPSCSRGCFDLFDAEWKLRRFVLRPLPQRLSTVF
jgi:hypothetical protein